MDSIRIKNLRSLVDTGDIKLNGLTVLVGENSCGKSTLLRTFPLIKQSFEENTTTPILWYGKYTDFGDFNQSVNKNDKEIVLEFNFTVNIGKGKLSNGDVMPFWMPYYSRRVFDNKAKLKYRMHLCSLNEKDYINKLEFEIDSNRISLVIDNKDVVKNLTVNNKDYSNFCNKLHIVKRKNNLVPIILVKYDKDISDEDYIYDEFGPYPNKRSPFADEIISIIKNNLHSNTSNQKIGMILNSFSITNKETLLKRLKDSDKGKLKAWDNFLNNVNTNDESSQFIDMLNLFICMNITNICQLYSSIINTFFNDVYYIAPIRANAERYYRIQNLSIDYVDFQGRNLPMLLKSLKGEDEIKFNTWMQDNFGFTIGANTSGDHLSIDIIKDGEKTNMADTGFGYSQVIPIIVQLWLLTHKNKRSMTLLIEQPELHLHPKLQAILVDTFVKCISIAKKEKIDLKIMLETHSETILNRIGYLIYKNKIDKKYTNVYLFEKINNNETKVEESFFDNQGYLENWPSGFFEPKEEL